MQQTWKFDRLQEESLGEHPILHFHFFSKSTNSGIYANKNVHFLFDLPSVKDLALQAP